MMQEVIADFAHSFALELQHALQGESRQVAALARAEGEALAHALGRIGGLLLRGEVSDEEAGVLLRIQRDASEAVLASLAQVSRIAASRAVASALEAGVAGAAGSAGQSGLLGLARTIAG
jgi:hypothetical protein